VRATTVIKEAINNKELPLDSLVLALFQLQMSRLNEFNRSIRQLVRYELKDQHANIQQINLGPMANLRLSDIVER